MFDVIHFDVRLFGVIGSYCPFFFVRVYFFFKTAIVRKRGDCSISVKYLFKWVYFLDVQKPQILFNFFLLATKLSSLSQTHAFKYRKNGKKCTNVQRIVVVRLDILLQTINRNWLICLQSIRTEKGQRRKMNWSRRKRNNEMLY